MAISVSNVKQGSHVALIIHGYNADYGKAAEYFKDVHERSAHLYDKVICYLWSSGDEFLEYYEAEERVENKKLPKRLATLVSEINAKAQRVDVIAHSMGCRLILESLKKSPQAPWKTSFSWIQLSIKIRFPQKSSKSPKRFSFFTPITMGFSIGLNPLQNGTNPLELKEITKATPTFI